MPDRAIDFLQAAGLHVRIHGALDLVVNGVPVEMKFRTRPSPSDLRRELRRWRFEDLGGKLAYVVPRATPSLVEEAQRDPRVMLIGLEDGTVISDRQVLSTQPDQKHPNTYRPLSSRIPWGRFAVMRALLRDPRSRPQIQLAREAGITQAAVSKVLRELGPAAEHARRGSRPAAERLWTRFMTEYPGPRGITSHWYSLEPPVQQIANVQVRFPNVITSGDTGADRIAPWRVVNHALIYSRVGLDLAELGFAEAEADESTLSVTVPADRTVWATAQAWADNTPIAPHTADPVIIAHDVRRTGGSDADEAVQRLHDAVFEAWRR